jgi:hypothetical protein
VTESTGTGHLQKGHGVSFADWDDDGDLDLFVVLGGGYPGDRGYNALFQNPGHGRHWLKVRLVGNQTNKSAIGARLRIDLAAPGGTRSIHRTISNNGSFGDNTLVESIGLLDAKSDDRLTVKDRCRPSWLLVLFRSRRGFGIARLGVGRGFGRTV